jgi:hypothetical protein
MLHPDIELGVVSAEIGFGVFATALIPKGTIVYIKDPLEIEIGDDDPRLRDLALLQIIERYSYIEPGGTRVLSWDLAKYMNHSCDPNTISTGYGFEIALRDIQKGEQVTDEYGLLNIEKNMPCGCDAHACRGWVRQDDVERHGKDWDAGVRDALENYRDVPQPLEYLIDPATRHQLQHYLDTGNGFVSVSQLRFFPGDIKATNVIGELSVVPGVG